MKPQYIAILSVLTLILVGIWIWEYWDLPTLKNLTHKALTSEDPKERELAVIKTLMYTDCRDAAPFLRRITTETKDPRVRIHAISRLSYFNDPYSGLLYLDAMEASERDVRFAGWRAISKMYGGNVDIQGPAGRMVIHYNPDDSPEERAKPIAKLRDFMTNPPPLPGDNGGK